MLFLMILFSENTSTVSQSLSALSFPFPHSSFMTVLHNHKDKFYLRRAKNVSIEWPILSQAVRNVFMSLNTDLENQTSGSVIRIKQLFSIVVLALILFCFVFVGLFCPSLSKNLLHSGYILYFPWALYLWWEFAVINIVLPVSLIKCCFIYSLLRIRLTVMEYWL